jgi:hypothetical protein
MRQPVPGKYWNTDDEVAFPYNVDVNSTDANPVAALDGVRTVRLVVLTRVNESDGRPLKYTTMTSSGAVDPRFVPMIVITVFPTRRAALGVAEDRLGAGLYVYGTPTPMPTTVEVTTIGPAAGVARAPDTILTCVLLMRV